MPKRHGRRKIQVGNLLRLSVTIGTFRDEAGILGRRAGGRNSVDNDGKDHKYDQNAGGRDQGGPVDPHGGFPGVAGDTITLAARPAW